MWLIVFALAALAVTYRHLYGEKRYGTGGLALVLWATAALVFVDHTIGWFVDGGMESGGEYFEIGLDPLMLSIAMLVPIFAIWELFSLKDRMACVGQAKECD